MRHPQVLIYEQDGRLTAMLESLVAERGWLLRQPRDWKDFAEALSPGGPSVVVLKVGRHLEFEMTVLDRLGEVYPEAATVVVADTDHAALAGLAWDLGAAYVHILPQPRDWLPEVVAGLMKPHQESRP